MGEEANAGAGPRHIVLIGMMGSGKTTVGRRVAKLLARPFRDADSELEARTGRSVRDWFEESGEVAFRRAEVEVLATLLGDPGPTVIAAGGGVVVEAANRAALGDAWVVWLDADPAFLASRVARKDHRPLLNGDPLTVLTALHAQREPWYREVAADIVDITPFHRTSESPKRDLAELVVARIRAAEAVPPRVRASDGRP